MELSLTKKQDILNTAQCPLFYEVQSMHCNSDRSVRLTSCNREQVMYDRSGSYRKGGEEWFGEVFRLLCA